MDRMDTVCFAPRQHLRTCIQQAQTSNMYTYHEHLVVIRMIFENIGVLEPIRLLIPSSMPHGPRGNHSSVSLEDELKNPFVQQVTEKTKTDNEKNYKIACFGLKVGTKIGKKQSIRELKIQGLPNLPFLQGEWYFRNRYQENGTSETVIKLFWG